MFSACDMYVICLFVVCYHHAICVLSVCYQCYLYTCTCYIYVICMLTICYLYVICKLRFADMNGETVVAEVVVALVPGAVIHSVSVCTGTSNMLSLCYLYVIHVFSAC